MDAGTQINPGSHAAASALHLEGVSKAYETAVALESVSVGMPTGAFTVLLGPSGCGKSTLLRLVAGLDTPTSGTIRLGGTDITERAPAERNLSMVFQSYALFPHLTVAQNIVFGLTVRRVPRAERTARLDRVARMLGLEALLERRPSQLSGGQQQRVALARAIISERPVCLMDEPLSNLDAKLRAEMRVELRALQRRLGLTLVYVTHDQVEAMTMADRIVVMNRGRVEQVASPRELYARPATTFCARFIGTPPMNLIPAEGFPGFERLARGSMVGIRPEDMVAGRGGVPARVEAIEYLGADQLLSARIGDTAIVVRQPARAEPAGETITVGWAPQAVHLFGPDGRRLPDFELHQQQG